MWNASWRSRRECPTLLQSLASLKGHTVVALSKHKGTSMAANSGNKALEPPWVSSLNILHFLDLPLKIEETLRCLFHLEGSKYSWWKTNRCWKTECIREAANTWWSPCRNDSLVWLWEDKCLGGRSTHFTPRHKVSTLSNDACVLTTN